MISERRLGSCFHGPPPLYKVWHIAAKLSHKTNLAITKLSLSLIHNTIGLGLPIFINATTRQQISLYSIGPYWYLLACTPTFGEVWGTKKNFRSLRSQILFLYLHLKICSPAPDVFMSLSVAHICFVLGNYIRRLEKNFVRVCMSSHRSRSGL